MTTIDRFDPFERRISDAVHRIADERRPPYLDDVLRLTARSSQRSRWTLPERWTPVNRTLIAAAMALVVIVGAGTYLLTRSNGPAPAGQPSPTPVTTSAPSPSVAPSYVAGAAPTAVWGDWHADNVSIQGVTTSELVRISFAWQDGRTGWVQLDGNSAGRQVLQFQALAAPAGEILVRAATGTQCTLGTIGRYRYSRSADGLFLTLNVIEDPCATRSDTFNRTWVHSLSAVNDGGLGIIPASPWIQVQLPKQRLAMSGGTDAADIHSLDGDPNVTLLEIMDPMGFEAPCQADNKPFAIDPNPAAFETYLRALPGLQLKASDATIGGIPARAFELTGVAKGACASGEVSFLHSRVATEDAQWSFATGEHIYAWAVVANGNLFVFAYEADGVTTAAAQQLADSIHFLNALPVP